MLQIENRLQEHKTTDNRKLRIEFRLRFRFRWQLYLFFWVGYQEKNPAMRGKTCNYVTVFRQNISKLDS